ncbi:MAG: DNA mismatch repair endonuclease MutL [Thermodesulfobacteriota bacterium]
MGKIRVLPDEVANRIAAGEVVERPASVVKELVENAVDAGGRRIRVRVEGAGKRSVAVEDDGSGMGRDDAVLALERHATSKLTGAEDLERIATLGFRGEALPSIASVSRFRLLTRAEGDPEGTEVRAEGGRLVSVEARGAARGTSVEVADLFFNVPARRKFLKGDATELRNVVETVTQLALAHFRVGFELRSGDRLLLALPPDQSLEERAAEVAGAEAPGGLRWSYGEADGLEFSLAFAAPHEGRGHRKGVRLFVNGRPVQDRLLFRALLEGYRGLLESGRFPVALLWLGLPPDEVDVNVHPAKREVRFRDEGRIFRWVAGHTAQALAGGFRPDAAYRSAPQALPASPVGAEAVARVGEALHGYARRLEGSRGGGGGAAAGYREQWPPRGGAASAQPLFRRFSGLEETGALPSEGRFTGLRYLGAFDATYLLFEDRENRELVLLDQHAAHERVLYEALLEARERGPCRAQPLLLPLTLECSPPERAAWEERREDLAVLGFRTEAFGPSAVAVTETPAGFSPEAARAAVRDLLGPDGEGREGGEAGAPVSRAEALARRAACAAAVKARAALEPSEVAALLGQLEPLRHPTHCPHGRPLLLRLRRRDVEGMFHRG